MHTEKKLPRLVKLSSHSTEYYNILKRLLVFITIYKALCYIILGQTIKMKKPPWAKLFHENSN